MNRISRKNRFVGFTAVRISRRRSYALFYCLLLLIATDFTTLPAYSQTDPHWTADWIAYPNAPFRDEGVFHFRKKITLDALPAHLPVEVSADNQFELIVNGHRAGSGPARGDLGHWRYETIDLAPFLHPGDNWIGATVWNFGVRSAIAQVSSRTGFYLNSIDEKYSDLKTNASWEVEEEKGIKTLPRPAAILKHYYAAEPATCTQGSIYDWDWENSRSQGRWRTAVSIGRGGLSGAVDLPVSWSFVPDSLPTMQRELAPVGRVVRTTGVDRAQDFPTRSVVIPPHTRASLLIDNTQLTTAYPELTVDGGKGARVRLTYTEALVDQNGVKGNRNEIAGKTAEGIYDEFLPDGKAQRVFEPLVWRTWRYLKIDVDTADQPLQLDQLRSWFTAFPFQERGSFQASDPSLEKIWEIGWRTARLCAHSTYMDTPYWEQLQYAGDTRIQALISYSVAGDDRLARQAIEALNDTRIPEGLTYSRGPSSLPQIIPPFSLFWVNMVHDFWMYRDDQEFTSAQLVGTRAVLAWFLAHVRADGMVGKLPWWLFVDWNKDFPGGVPPQDGNGGSAIITLQMVSALRDAADLESALGDPATAKLYRKAADRSAQAVRALCWNRQLDLIADTKEQKHYSQETNAFAIWLDVIPPNRQREALNEVLSTTDPAFHTNQSLPEIAIATYYFRFYLARALVHAGMGDRYTQMLDPWRRMMVLGLTTWAEKPEPTRSDSHAWSASPNYDLPTIVAGICPGSPGFRTVRIEPHLGTLIHVTARMPIPKGIVAVEFTRNQQQVLSLITLPPGVNGDLVWKRHSYPLHGGEQKIELPAR